MFFQLIFSVYKKVKTSSKSLRFHYLNYTPVNTRRDITHLFSPQTVSSRANGHGGTFPCRYNWVSGLF